MASVGCLVELVSVESALEKKEKNFDKVLDVIYITYEII